MNEADSQRGPAARERVLVFLSFFTSPESRRAFAPALPEDRLAYELCSIWFDDVFVAGTRYLEGLKGDYDESAATEFRAAFTDEEWKYLERFHRFLELRIDMMPAAARRERRLPDSPVWQSIVRDAGYLLELLEPDPARRRAYTRAKLNKTG